MMRAQLLRKPYTVHCILVTPVADDTVFCQITESKRIKWLGLILR